MQLLLKCSHSFNRRLSSRPDQELYSPGLLEAHGLGRTDRRAFKHHSRGAPGDQSRRGGVNTTSRGRGCLS